MAPETKIDTLDVRERKSTEQELAALRNQLKGQDIAKIKGTAEDIDAPTSLIDFFKDIYLKIGIPNVAANVLKDMETLFRKKTNRPLAEIHGYAISNGILTVKFNENDDTAEIIDLPLFPAQLSDLSAEITREEPKNNYALSAHEGGSKIESAIIIVGGVDATPFSEKGMSAKEYEKKVTDAKFLLALDLNRFTPSTQTLITEHRSELEALSTQSDFSRAAMNANFELNGRTVEESRERIFGATGVYNIVLAFQRILDIYTAENIRRSKTKLEFQIGSRVGDFNGQDERFSQATVTQVGVENNLDSIGNPRDELQITDSVGAAVYSAAAGDDVPVRVARRKRTPRTDAVTGKDEVPAKGTETDKKNDPELEKNIPVKISADRNARQFEGQSDNADALAMPAMGTIETKMYADHAQRDLMKIYGAKGRDAFIEGIRKLPASNSVAQIIEASLEELAKKNPQDAVLALQQMLSDANDETTKRLVKIVRNNIKTAENPSKKAVWELLLAQLYLGAGPFSTKAMGEIFDTIRKINIAEISPQEKQMIDLQKQYFEMYVRRTAADQLVETQLSMLEGGLEEKDDVGKFQATERTKQDIANDLANIGWSTFDKDEEAYYGSRHVLEMLSMLLKYDYPNNPKANPNPITYYLDSIASGKLSDNSEINIDTKNISVPLHDYHGRPIDLSSKAVNGIVSLSSLFDEVFASAKEEVRLYKEYSNGKENIDNHNSFGTTKKFGYTNDNGDIESIFNTLGLNGDVSSFNEESLDAKAQELFTRKINGLIEAKHYDEARSLCLDILKAKIDERAKKDYSKYFVENFNSERRNLVKEGWQGKLEAQAKLEIAQQLGIKDSTDMGDDYDVSKFGIEGKDGKIITDLGTYKAFIAGQQLDRMAQMKVYEEKTRDFNKNDITLDLTPFEQTVYDQFVDVSGLTTWSLRDENADFWTDVGISIAELVGISLITMGVGTFIGAAAGVGRGIAVGAEVAAGGARTGRSWITATRLGERVARISNRAGNAIRTGREGSWLDRNVGEGVRLLNRSHTAAEGAGVMARVGGGLKNAGAGGLKLAGESVLFQAQEMALRGDLPDSGTDYLFQLGTTMATLGAGKLAHKATGRYMKAASSPTILGMARTGARTTMDFSGQLISGMAVSSYQNLVSNTLGFTNLDQLQAMGKIDDMGNLTSGGGYWYNEFVRNKEWKEFAHTTAVTFALFRPRANAGAHSPLSESAPLDSLKASVESHAKKLEAKRAELTEVEKRISEIDAEIAGLKEVKKNVDNTSVEEAKVTKLEQEFAELQTKEIKLGEVCMVLETRIADAQTADPNADVTVIEADLALVKGEHNLAREATDKTQKKLTKAREAVANKKALRDTSSEEAEVTRTKDELKALQKAYDKLVESDAEQSEIDQSQSNLNQAKTAYERAVKTLADKKAERKTSTKDARKDAVSIREAAQEERAELKGKAAKIRRDITAAEWNVNSATKRHDIAVEAEAAVQQRAEAATNAEAARVEAAKNKAESEARIAAEAKAQAVKDAQNIADAQNKIDELKTLDAEIKKEHARRQAEKGDADTVLKDAYDRIIKALTTPDKVPTILEYQREYVRELREKQKAAKAQKAKDAESITRKNQKDFDKAFSGKSNQEKVEALDFAEAILRKESGRDEITKDEILERATKDELAEQAAEKAKTKAEREEAIAEAARLAAINPKGKKDKGKKVKVTVNINGQTGTGPAPEAQAAPEPKPAPEAQAGPEPKPAPEAQAAPKPKPAPEAQAAPEPKPAPKPSPVAEPVPQVPDAEIKDFVDGKKSYIDIRGRELPVLPVSSAEMPLAMRAAYESKNGAAVDMSIPEVLDYVSNHIDEVSRLVVYDFSKNLGSTDILNRIYERGGMVKHSASLQLGSDWSVETVKSHGDISDLIPKLEGDILLAASTPTKIEAIPEGGVHVEYDITYCKSVDLPNHTQQIISAFGARNPELLLKGESLMDAVTGLYEGLESHANSLPVSSPERILAHGRARVFLRDVERVVSQTPVDDAVGYIKGVRDALLKANGVEPTAENIQKTENQISLIKAANFYAEIKTEKGETAPAELKPFEAFDVGSGSPKLEAVTPLEQTSGQSLSDLILKDPAEFLKVGVVKNQNGEVTDYRRFLDAKPDGGKTIREDFEKMLSESPDNINVVTKELQSYANLMSGGIERFTARGEALDAAKRFMSDYDSFPRVFEINSGGNKIYWLTDDGYSSKVNEHMDAFYTEHPDATFNELTFYDPTFNYPVTPKSQRREQVAKARKAFAAEHGATEKTKPGELSPHEIDALVADIAPTEAQPARAEAPSVSRPANAESLPVTPELVQKLSHVETTQLRKSVEDHILPEDLCAALKADPTLYDVLSRVYSPKRIEQMRALVDEYAQYGDAEFARGVFDALAKGEALLPARTLENRHPKEGKDIYSQWELDSMLEAVNRYPDVPPPAPAVAAAPQPMNIDAAPTAEKAVKAAPAAEAAPRAPVAPAEAPILTRIREAHAALRSEVERISPDKKFEAAVRFVAGKEKISASELVDGLKGRIYDTKITLDEAIKYLKKLESAGLVGAEGTGAETNNRPVLKTFTTQRAQEYLKEYTTEVEAGIEFAMALSPDLIKMPKELVTLIHTYNSDSSSDAAGELMQYLVSKIDGTKLDPQQLRKLDIAINLIGKNHGLELIIDSTIESDSPFRRSEELADINPALATALAGLKGPGGSAEKKSPDVAPEPIRAEAPTRAERPVQPNWRPDELSELFAEAAAALPPAPRPSAPARTEAIKRVETPTQEKTAGSNRPAPALSESLRVEQLKASIIDGFTAAFKSVEGISIKNSRTQRVESFYENIQRAFTDRGLKVRIKPIQAGDYFLIEDVNPQSEVQWYVVAGPGGEQSPIFFWGKFRNPNGDTSRDPSDYVTSKPAEIHREVDFKPDVDNFNRLELFFPGEVKLRTNVVSPEAPRAAAPDSRKPTEAPQMSEVAAARSLNAETLALYSKAGLSPQEAGKYPAELSAAGVVTLHENKIAAEQAIEYFVPLKEYGVTADDIVYLTNATWGGRNPIPVKRAKEYYEAFKDLRSRGIEIKGHDVHALYSNNNIDPQKAKTWYEALQGHKLNADHAFHGFEIAYFVSENTPIEKIGEYYTMLRASGLNTKSEAVRPRDIADLIKGGVSPEKARQYYEQIKESKYVIQGETIAKAVKINASPALFKAYVELAESLEKTVDGYSKLYTSEIPDLISAKVSLENIKKYIDRFDARAMCQLTLNGVSLEAAKNYSKEFSWQQVRDFVKGGLTSEKAKKYEKFAKRFEVGEDILALDKAGVDIEVAAQFDKTAGIEDVIELMKLEVDPTTANEAAIRLWSFGMVVEFAQKGLSLKAVHDFAPRFQPHDIKVLLTNKVYHNAANHYAERFSGYDIVKLRVNSSSTVVLPEIANKYDTRFSENDILNLYENGIDYKIANAFNETFSAQDIFRLRSMQVSKDKANADVVLGVDGIIKKHGSKLIRFSNWFAGRES